MSQDAKTGTILEALKFADVIVLATPYEAAPDAIEVAGDLRRKVLWSIVNPLKSDLSGLQVGTNTLGAEELATLATGAHFVAALPPFAEVLHSHDLPDPAPSVFVCSDEPPADSGGGSGSSDGQRDRRKANSAQRNPFGFSRTLIPLF